MDSNDSESDYSGFVGSEDDSDEERSAFSDEDDTTFSDIMRALHQNYTLILDGSGEENWIQNMSNEDWEQLGRGSSNNTTLGTVRFYEGALNDQKMRHLFRGLTRSSAIKDMVLRNNELSVAGVQNMVPFLQNANNLEVLDLGSNNLQSEGFNMLIRALRNSPIKRLTCCSCSIASIQINNNHIPEHLTYLNLNSNIIDADGCRGLVELLLREDSTLSSLFLFNNKIDDDAVAILVDALQNNTSLTSLGLFGNDGISNHGKISLLKLVNDISSIKATLQSNHTLKYIHISTGEPSDLNQKIQTNIEMATDINGKNQYCPEAAGREKVIRTQLHSGARVELCRLQDVNHSVYRDIDPLHLPEVLSLIGRHHGQEELYVALSSSIMTLFSTVNMKKCIQQERAYHAAKVEELDAKLAAMEGSAAGNEGYNDINHRSSKRRRKWWGLWGGA